MQHQLSTNNGAVKVTLSGLGLAIMLILLIGAAQSMSLWGIIIISILFSLLGVLLVALIMDGLRSFDLYYDDMNLYLNGRSKQIVVPFRVITSVKKDSGHMKVGGRPLFQFTIYYRDENGQPQEVDFWKSLEDGSAEDFQYKVRKFNGR